MNVALTAEEINESLEVTKRLDGMQGSVGVDCDLANSGYTVLKRGKVIYEHNVKGKMIITKGE